MEHSSANSVLEFKDSLYGIDFKVPIFNNWPIVQVQDMKHTKKIARNQIHYKIRLITFGNSTIRYDQLCDLVKKENSGLCICDVYNVDKQDDRMVFCIFHSRLLGMYQDNGIIDLRKLDLFVYLFVLGKW
jgi:hypothetical protein